MKGVRTEIYSRVVGYMRPVSEWNVGKKEEFRERKTYKLKDIDYGATTPGRDFQETDNISCRGQS